MEMEAMIDAVRDFLDDSGYRYEYNAEHKYLQLGFNLKCKLKHARIYFEFRPAGYLVYAISPINADTDNIGEMLKFIAMANYNLVNGNFEVDVEDGEIRYKCWVGLWKLDSYPPDMIDESLRIPLFMFDRYGNGIAALAMGFSDAQTEIEKIEKADEEPDGEETEED